MKSLFEKNTLYLDAIPQPNEYLHRLILNDKTRHFIFMDSFDTNVNKIYTGKFILNDTDSAHKLILFYEYDVNPYPSINEDAYKKINGMIELDFSIISPQQNMENSSYKHSVIFSKSPIPSSLHLDNVDYHKIFYA